MDTSTALKSLAALSHENRLAIFRLLVEQGTTGIAAGADRRAAWAACGDRVVHLKELINASSQSPAAEPLHLLPRELRRDERPHRVPDRQLLHPQRGSVSPNARRRVRRPANTVDARCAGPFPARREIVQKESRMKRFHVHVSVPISMPASGSIRVCSARSRRCQKPD
jgi:hypothetical protein